MKPLTDEEAKLLFRIIFAGTGGYPITHSNSMFHVPSLVTSLSFHTRGAAIQEIERWAEETSARWSHMKKQIPGVTLDEDGIHFPSQAS